MNKTQTNPGTRVTGNLGFNKACEIEDFSHPDLSGVIRDVCRHKLPYFDPAYPVGAEYNKDWEVAMAVRALRHFGALNPESVILGIAAGKEDTIFYLTRYVRQVFATDRYLESAGWEALAPPAMMIDPGAISPFRFEPDRLVVQHMDARLLQFPDDTFDGIFSSGSIEHFGELDEIAAAAYEMGRVLRPGGIASISTVIKVVGPPQGYGWPGATVLMSRDQIMRYIVEASGLEPVDDFDITTSRATMATARNLVQVQQDREAIIRQRGEMARFHDFAFWDLPHIILEHGDYVFNSVHLALRKPDSGASAAMWAKPSPAIGHSIRRYNQSFLNRSGTTPQAPPPGAVASKHLNEILHLKDRLERIIARQTDLNDRMDPPVWPMVTIPQTWVGCPVRLSEGVQFEIMVDEGAGDHISLAYRAGQGHLVNADMLGIMLSLVKPGDNMLDLGGFMGTFALTASAAGCNVCVIEANPTNAVMMRISAVRNGFNRMRVVECAATDSLKTLDFFSHGPWGRVVQTEGTEPTTPITGLPIDDVLDALGWDRVAFIKIDVEGSEVPALQGLNRLLTGQQAPPIIMESNGHTLRLCNSSPQQLHQELTGLGYTPYLIKPGCLVQLETGQIQPNTVVDWLAVKGPLPDLPGYRVEPAASIQDLIAALIYEGTLPTEDHRAYVAGALEHAPEEIRQEERIVRLLSSLHSDPVGAVSHAAAWWAANDS